MTLTPRAALIFLGVVWGCPSDPVFVDVDGSVDSGGGADAGTDVSGDTTSSNDALSPDTSSSDVGSLDTGLVDAEVVDTAPADPCAADASNALSTLGCNGTAANENPAPDSLGGACVSGTCSALGAACDAPSSTCQLACDPASTFVSTGSCPVGSRCFTLGATAECRLDCMNASDCPGGFDCNGEGSCVWANLNDACAGSDSTMNVSCNGAPTALSAAPNTHGGSCSFDYSDAQGSCNAGLRCDGATLTCVAECVRQPTVLSTSNCPTGTRCDSASGQPLCRFACTDVSHCPSGMICTANECVYDDSGDPCAGTDPSMNIGCNGAPTMQNPTDDALGGECDFDAEDVQGSCVGAELFCDFATERCRSRCLPHPTGVSSSSCPASSRCLRDLNGDFECRFACNTAADCPDELVCVNGGCAWDETLDPCGGSLATAGTKVGCNGAVIIGLSAPAGAFMGACTYNPADAQSDCDEDLECTEDGRCSLLMCPGHQTHSSTGTCPSGSRCFSLELTSGVCRPDCMSAADCPAGYSCNGDNACQRFS